MFLKFKSYLNAVSGQSDTGNRKTARLNIVEKGYLWYKARAAMVNKIRGKLKVYIVALTDGENDRFNTIFY